MKMAAVAIHEPTAERPLAEGSAQRLFEPGGATLEDAVLEIWEELVIHGRAECPICGDSMSAAGCESCGAELS